MRVVLDTNVILSGIIVPHNPPAQLLTLAQEGRFKIILSPKIIREIQRVLGYPRLAKFMAKHRLSLNEADEVLQKIIKLALLTPGNLEVQALQVDPSDNNILACAVEGEADFIISGDHHLTDLQSFQGIRIMDPATLLSMIKSA